MISRKRYTTRRNETWRRRHRLSISSSFKLHCPTHVDRFRTSSLGRTSTSLRSYSFSSQYCSSDTLLSPWSMLRCSRLDLRLRRRVTRRSVNVGRSRFFNLTIRLCFVPMSTCLYIANPAVRADLHNRILATVFCSVLWDKRPLLLLLWL